MGIYGRRYRVENIYREMILRVGNIWEGTNGWWEGGYICLTIGIEYIPKNLN
jgi:hypothetical protein